MKTLKVVTVICVAVSWAMLTGVFLTYGMTGILPTDMLILACCVMGLANVGLLVIRKESKPTKK